ncbi:DNA recombination protein RmuC [hydrothermal vent metagenome]|uniref:DNA recombination protein RmuC n=1 Tax=hydrothermal vent metagenome TaxID=652676 RepID=A0A3B0RF42_9ZZZZ
MIEIDTNTLIITAGVVCAVVLLIVLLRRQKSIESALRSENIKLISAADRQKEELKHTATKADRAEALAEERKREAARLMGDLSKLRLRLDEKIDEELQLTSIISQLETEMRSEKAAAADKIQLLTRLRADMEAKFRELAQEALKVQGDAFAKSNLEKLEATLTPLKEHVGHFEAELKQVHQDTIKDRAQLKAEIRQLSQRSEEISQEAVMLTRALKGDKQKQGAWGEMILENVLERSGLREGEEFETQAHRVGNEGERYRPDVIVRIPGGKTLVIDSKVSLVAYADAVNAETGEEAAAARKRHVISLRSHIKSLAAKGYHNAEEASVDYVIMFVPVEGALSEALREDGNLTEHAMENNIMIATPTTLMMALKTIANVWAVERRNKNAEQIAARAGSLYDKVAGFVDNMENIGSRLGQANEAYDKAFDQLSRGRGNVLFQVEKLRKLGAKTSKSIGAEFDEDEEIPQIEE